MAGEWQTRTLRDFCRKPNGGIQTGPFGSQLHRADYVDAGVPVIMPTNIQAGRLAEDGIARVSEAKADELKRHRVRIGDIIFSRRGEVDKCAVVTEREMDWLCGTGCLLARVDPKLADARFIGYHISLPETRAWLQQNAVGLVMPNLNTGILESIPIHAPSRIEQEQIADLLASLDAKVDLNRQMAATLEEMARALFKSWFVNFDPVHAKAEGRNTGLPANIGALFPDNFDDEGLPNGWTWGTPENLVEVNPTTRIDRANEAPYIDMAALPTQGHRIKSAVSRPVGSGARFKNGDTLLARITPCLENGKTAFVDCLDDDAIAWGSTEFIVMRPLEGTPEPLAYLIARDASFRSHIIASMSGTSGRQRAPSEAIGRWNMAIPTEAVISAWGDAVIPIFYGIKAKSVEAEQLMDLRDTLLPRLLSGDLRVAEAEAAIAAA